MSEELYQGLAVHDGSLRALFALSEPVKSGFDVHHPDYAEKPEFISIAVDDLFFSYRQDGFYTLPELGIRLDAHTINQILSVAKDIKGIFNGVTNLPQVEERNTVILQLDWAP